MSVFKKILTYAMWMNGFIWLKSLKKKMPNEMAWMDSRDLSLVIIERTLLITLLRLYSTILVRTMISRDFQHFLQIFRMLFRVFDAKVINDARVHRIIKTKQKSELINRINIKKCIFKILYQNNHKTKFSKYGRLVALKKS